MEQIQKHFVKFHSSSLKLHSLGRHAEAETGYTILPVEWPLIEPFFVNFKNLNDYFPLIEKGSIVGFRKKKMSMTNTVRNDDSNTVKAIRHFENFIADCAIRVTQDVDSITLRYDEHYFDTITNQENIDRLTLVKGNLYNMHITEKGNPYCLIETYETKLDDLIDIKFIRLPCKVPKEISVYAIAKNC
jgi:hypothetical protein